MPALCTQPPLAHPCRPCSPAWDARRWRSSCVCVFPTYSCAVVCPSDYRQFCLFQVHISWPWSDWPVAAPTLAVQPAVSFFSLIKHVPLSLKLHLSKSLPVLGNLDWRDRGLLPYSMEQTRTWWCNVCFISRERWTNLTFTLQNLKLQHSQRCLPKPLSYWETFLKNILHPKCAFSLLSSLNSKHFDFLGKETISYYSKIL